MKGELAMVSSLAVINKFGNRFKPTGDNWLIDAIEWVGEALKIMNIIQGLIPDAIDKEIVAYKVKVPICPDALLSVDYENCYLPLDRPSKFSNDCCTIGHGRARGYIKGPYLQTNFETGTVTFHVLTFPTCEKGFPLVPNNVTLFEAITWYCLREYLAQGNKHHTFSWGDADAMWEKYWPRAANSVDFPKLYNQDAFKNMWVSLIPQLHLHLVGNRTFNYDSINGTGSNLSDFTGNALINQFE